MKGSGACRPTTALKLTRFRGHLILMERGVRDVKNPSAIRT